MAAIDRMAFSSLLIALPSVSLFIKKIERGRIHIRLPQGTNGR